MRARRKSAHHNLGQIIFIVILVTKAEHIGYRSSSQEDTSQPKANLWAMPEESLREQEFPFAIMHNRICWDFCGKTCTD